MREKGPVEDDMVRQYLDLDLVELKRIVQSLVQVRTGGELRKHFHDALVAWSSA